MNKSLTVFTVLLAGYLAYGAFTDNKNEEITKQSEQAQVNSNSDLNSDLNSETIDEVELYTEQFIEGTFVLTINTDTAESTQHFTFYKDGNFTLTREMVRPFAGLRGEISGSYTIENNDIKLVFPQERDKKAFPVDTAKLEIKTNDELVYNELSVYRS